MPRLVAVIGFQVYALLLAFSQHMAGVRTDEAKYLLNIPYPHPPLVRGLFGLTSSWPFQEIFWRVVLATLLVQAVWIVWSMGKSLLPRERIAVCAAWLLCGGVAFQAGAILMAPVTALQGLIFAWLYVRRDIDVTRFAGWLAMFWALSLFSAFQSLLFLPLVLGLFWRSRLPLWFQLFCVFAPVGLLALYVAGHPLIAASFVLVSGDNAGVGIFHRLLGIPLAWGIGGSIWLALTGLAGTVMRRQSALFWTLALLSAYMIVSYHDYYAVLFAPVFIAGTALLLRRRPLHPLIIAGPVLLGTALLMPFAAAVPGSDPAPPVLAAVAARGSSGTLLINGSFGHQWQYESPFEIRRYRTELINRAQAVVCLQSCADMGDREEWMPMRGLGVEVWVRR